MVEGGRTPFLFDQRTGKPGLQIALFPGTGFLTAARALREAYGYLQGAGTSVGGPAQLPFADMNARWAFRRFTRSRRSGPDRSRGSIDRNRADHAIPVVVGAGQLILSLGRRDQQDPDGFARLHDDVGAAVRQQLRSWTFAASRKPGAVNSCRSLPRFSSVSAMPCRRETSDGQVRSGYRPSRRSSVQRWPMGRPAERARCQ